MYKFNIFSAFLTSGSNRSVAVIKKKKQKPGFAYSVNLDSDNNHSNT